MSFKLLLADDSITIQKVVSIIFSGEEYDLTIVSNGTVALEKAAEVVPDVMLVDTLMPGASGYEVCEGIRADQRLRHVPILLLTGAFEPFNVEKARESGADDFISKPFESQVLIEKVQSLIELGRERQVSPAVSAPVSPSVPDVSAEEPFWSFEPPAQEPAVSSPAAALSTQPASDSIWGDFQIEGADEPLQTGQPSPWQPADAGRAEALWELEPDSGEAAASGAVPEAFSAEGAAAESSRAEEMVEVAPDDDLWGAFQLEPVPAGAVDPVDILETYTVDAGASATDEEPFAFAEPAEPADAFFFGTADAESVMPAPAEEIPAVSPFAAFEVEPEAAATPFAPPAAEAFPDAQSAGSEGYFFSGSEIPQSEQVVGALEEQPAPISTDAPAASAPPAATGAGQDVVALNEQQLAAVISRISREVIEKVVWEVVPDLAEILIKEEIRKIKEGR